MERVLILGAGFSGLGLATRLSEEIPDAVEVTLIDQSESFVLGYSKLDVMFGREKPESVHMYYRDIVKPCDHVHDHAKGGPTAFANLGWLCYAHHRLKSGGWELGPPDPETGKRRLRAPPARAA